MDIALKQRLVGASVIIALAIIFIPMIFDDTNTRQNRSITIAIPDEPEGLKHKVINIDSSKMIGNKTSDYNNQVPKNNDNLQRNQSKTEDFSVIDKKETIVNVVDNTKETPKTKAEPKIDKSITRKPNEKDNQDSLKVQEKPLTTEPLNNTVKNESILSFRVKFGVFSQQKNAQQLKAKIINSGNTAIVEKKGDKGLYVVYSKELISKVYAQHLVEGIQKLNLNIGKPSIETLNTVESEAAEYLLDTGWIIQIGSFSSKENSIKLRDKIRNKGFISFVDEIINSKKQKRYRVRVGPYATRDESLIVKKNIQKKMSLKGLIKPHEKQKVIVK